MTSVANDGARDRPGASASSVGRILDALPSIADDSPVALAVTEGKDHVVRYCNPALCRLTALPLDEIVGRPLAAVFYTAPPLRAVALLDRVLETGEAGRTDDVAPGRAGLYAEPVSYLAWPIRHSAEGAAGLVVQMSATERILDADPAADADTELRTANRRLLVAGLEAQEQAEAQEAVATSLRVLAEALELSERRHRARAAELQATIEGIEDGVAVVTATGEIVFANHALARALGGPVGSEAELRTALGGADLEARLEPGQIQPVDGRRWLEVRTFDVHGDDGSETGSRVVMVRDVTDERLASQARDAFIGVLSHELRTPVTTILGMSRLLDQGPERLRDMAGLRLARDIATESERLYRLVEDLLVLSRTEGRRLEFEREPVLVQHIVREAIAAEAPRFPNVAFVADLPALPPVAGDPTYVRQIVSNLLSNAGKYGPDGSCEVRVVGKRSGDDVVVRVVDEGPGFPAADAERLFELFFRTDDSTRRKAGAGIGLYVTRALAEAMGGRAWAKVGRTGGAEFGFALPVMVSDAGRPSRVRRPARRRRGPAPTA